MERSIESAFTPVAAHSVSSAPEIRSTPFSWSRRVCHCLRASSCERQGGCPRWLRCEVVGRIPEMGDVFWLFSMNWGA
jgi:hypothetical protein